MTESTGSSSGVSSKNPSMSSGSPHSNSASSTGQKSKKDPHGGVTARSKSSHRQMEMIDPSKRHSEYLNDMVEKFPQLWVKRGELLLPPFLVLLPFLVFGA